MSEQLKLTLTSYSLKINGRRYDRRLMSKSSLNRLMNVINALPDAHKSVEIEDDLSITLYVFMPRKEVKPVQQAMTVLNADVATTPATVTAPVRKPLNRPASVVNFGEELVISRGEKTRAYDTFGRLATSGENRLYAWLKANEELFTVTPFVIKDDGLLMTATVSKVWKSK